jgi:cytochrome c556
MKTISIRLATALLALAIPTMSSHGEDQTAIQKLMTKKLQSAQKVFEGLATNNYDLIATNAEELIQVSKAAEFGVLKTPQYETHNNEFRRAAETLIEQAKAKNTDEAARAYVDLTLSCVRCHKHVREVRMARLDFSR